MLPRYDAILFDYDGVLVDSEPVHYQCWREALAAHGVELPWEYYAAHSIGVSDDRVADAFGSLAPGGEAWFADALRWKRALYAERSAAAGLVRAEVRELLRGLGLPLAVVTSSPRDEVEPLLAASGVLDLFGACVYRECVARPKPDPEPYLTAAALLGARYPLVIEDSEAGERSARAAGFDCLRLACQGQLSEALRRRLG